MNFQAYPGQGVISLEVGKRMAALARISSTETSVRSTDVSPTPQNTGLLYGWSLLKWTSRLQSIQNDVLHPKSRACGPYFWVLREAQVTLGVESITCTASLLGARSPSTTRCSDPCASLTSTSSEPFLGLRLIWGSGPLWKPKMSVLGDPGGGFMRALLAPVGDFGGHQAFGVDTRPLGLTPWGMQGHTRSGGYQAFGVCVEASC